MGTLSENVCPMSRGCVYLCVFVCVNNGISIIDIFHNVKMAVFHIHFFNSMRIENSGSEAPWSHTPHIHTSTCQAIHSAFFTISFHLNFHLSFTICTILITIKFEVGKRKTKLLPSCCWFNWHESNYLLNEKHITRPMELNLFTKYTIHISLHWNWWLLHN